MDNISHVAPVASSTFTDPEMILGSGNIDSIAAAAVTAAFSTAIKAAASSSELSTTAPCSLEMSTLPTDLAGNGSGVNCSPSKHEENPNATALKTATREDDPAVDGTHDPGDANNTACTMENDEQHPPVEAGQEEAKSSNNTEQETCSGTVLSSIPCESRSDDTAVDDMTIGVNPSSDEAQPMEHSSHILASKEPLAQPQKSSANEAVRLEPPGVTSERRRTQDIGLDTADTVRLSQGVDNLTDKTSGEYDKDVPPRTLSVSADEDEGSMGVGMEQCHTVDINVDGKRSYAINTKRGSASAAPPNVAIGDDEELGEDNRRTTSQTVAHSQDDGREIDSEKGQVVYIGQAKEAETVWVAGRREAVDIKVSERVSPSYQLTISVEVAKRRLQHQGDIACRAGGNQVAEFSLRIGKPEIKEALLRWIGSTSESGRLTSLDETGGEGGAAADAALRRWISGGRVPRRAHLLRWLLWRLELVQDLGRLAGAEASRRTSEVAQWWVLVLRNFAENAGGVDNVSQSRNADNAGDVQDPRNAGIEDALNEHERGPQDTNRDSDVRRKSHGGNKWWDTETWERESTMLTNRSSGSSSAIPPPAYRDVLQHGIPMAAPLPPSYDYAVHRDGLQSPKQNSRQGNKAVTRCTSSDSEVPSPDSLSRETPPPSYRSRSSDDSNKNPNNKENKCMGRGDKRRYGSTGGSRPDSADGLTPPPSYRLFVESQREGKYRRHGGRAASTVPASYHEDRAASPTFVYRWLENEKERRNAREHERERGEQIHDTSSDYHRKNVEMSGKEKLERPASFTWGGRGRMANTEDKVLGASRSSPVGERTNGNTKQRSYRRGNLGEKESWDDDRWRLTAYLKSCKRELTEAEERRRRAEAAAAAAERTARSTFDQGGTNEREKRAWARAATQRVLDLMLVAERLRQEEQKRRVSSARAHELMARRKQPFRERRGKSVKGPSLGPAVPPTEALDTRSDPRVERAIEKFYWDEHGRRYRRTDHGSGEVDMALDTVRSAAAACLEEGIDFGQPFQALDADDDGRLTLAELGTALRRVGVPLKLSHVTTLFRHLDPTGSGTISRREFLWELVDKQRLVVQWENARGERGMNWTRMAPFRDRADAPGSGRMGRAEFLRALGEVPVVVQGWEAEALLDQFQVSENGHIDWREFVSFMSQEERNEDKKKRADSRRQHAYSPSLYQSRRPNAERRDDDERTRPGGSGGGYWESAKLDGNWTIRNRRRRTPGTAVQSRLTEEVPGTYFRGGLFDPANAHSSTWGPMNRETGTSARAATAPQSSFQRRPRAADRNDMMSDNQLARRRAGGGVEQIPDAAAALEVVDQLLDDQRELEAFLQEEFTRRGLVGPEADDRRL